MSASAIPMMISMDEVEADAMDALAAALAEMAASATAMGRATMLGARSGVAKLAALLRGTAVLVPPEARTREAAELSGSGQSLGPVSALRACARLDHIINQINPISDARALDPPREGARALDPYVPSTSSTQSASPAQEPAGPQGVAEPGTHAGANQACAEPPKSRQAEPEGQEPDDEVSRAIQRLELDWRDRLDPNAAVLNDLKDWLCKQRAYTRCRWLNWLQTLGEVGVLYRREVVARITLRSLKNQGGADLYMRKTLDSVRKEWKPPLLPAVVDNGRQVLLPYPQGAMPIVQTDFAKAQAKSDDDKRRREETQRREKTEHAARQAAKSPEQIAWEAAEGKRFREDIGWYIKTRGGFKNGAEPRPPVEPRAWPGPGSPLPVILTSVAEYVKAHPPFTPAEEAAYNAAKRQREEREEREYAAKKDAERARETAARKRKAGAGATA